MGDLGKDYVLWAVGIPLPIIILSTFLECCGHGVGGAGGREARGRSDARVSQRASGAYDGRASNLHSNLRGGG
ncbi:MAG: hypothetical protein IPG56_20115 [Caulobacteraceae bacterium]|nr:hypothetical protein [Caulobacteraceae bacterium]